MEQKNVHFNSVMMMMIQIIVIRKTMIMMMMAEQQKVMNLKMIMKINKIQMEK
jgi:hypothetical protein